MNSMNDESFFDLAMKVIARQATDAERADLDALLAQEAELRSEFARLETDARVAKDALLFINACTASTGEFPAYARERLQTAVRQTLGRPNMGSDRAPIETSTPALAIVGTEAAPREPDRSLAWGWRWMPRLAIATAAVLLLALPVVFLQRAAHTKAKVRTTNTPLIQLAILDTGSGTRGADTDEVATIKETWKGISIQSFSSVSELQAWEKNWPSDGGRRVARIVYDPSAGEVRVAWRSQGRVFQKTFPVDRDLATTLQQVRVFIREQTKR
jgi:hypothetical protein